MTTARYSFMHFITSLQESHPLQEEMSRARNNEVNYGQYAAHPHDVRYPGNRRGARLNVRTARRYVANDRDHSRSRSSYERLHRERSRSPYFRERRSANTVERSRNPSLGKRRYCYGCGAEDQILSDKKCTPSLNSIKTNVTEQRGCDQEIAVDIAEQMFSFQSSGSLR